MQERERVVHRQAIAEWLNVAAGGVGRAGLREASRMEGAREEWGDVERKALRGSGEDWSGVADRTVSQPCFVVGMRSQRGMTLHVSTFARRRWHDIKTTRGSLYVYIRCHVRVSSSVASNRVINPVWRYREEACFPGCATVRCSIPVSPSSAFLASIGVSLCARRERVSTTAPRRRRRPVVRAEQFDSIEGKPTRNTSWNREWNLLINTTACPVLYYE